MEVALEQGIDLAKLWVKQKGTIEVDIFNEFSIAIKSTADIEQLLKARLAGEITSKTFLKELKRRALLADSVNIEDEVQEAQEELNAKLESGIT